MNYSIDKYRKFAILGLKPVQWLGTSYERLLDLPESAIKQTIKKTKKTSDKDLHLARKAYAELEKIHRKKNG